MLCAWADFFFYGANPIRNAAQTYNIFFRGFFCWVKILKMMLIPKKFCALKFPKICEKVFTIAGSRDEQTLKKEYIFELYITQAFFCLLSWNFTTTRSKDMYSICIFVQKIKLKFSSSSVIQALT